MNINKLKALMVEFECSRKTISELLGINESTLKNKLLGKSDFKFTEVQKIADYFKVDINIFLPITSQNGKKK
jgi:transcriptional regulator with XRE-family HTH domain